MKSMSVAEYKAYLQTGETKETPRKYHNKPVVVDGERYDSQKECVRHQELRLLEQRHFISDLRRQVSYELIPRQVICGKTHRAIVYKADFVYVEKGRAVVEDVKSVATKTPLYKLKKRLMLAVHGIEIKET